MTRTLARTADTVAGRLDAGDLTGAIAQATAAVKAAPRKPEARLLLADLLLVAGDYERADKALALIGTLNPAGAVGVGLARGLLQGLMARRAWVESGALPAFPNGPTPADEAALRLNLALRADDADDAASSLEALEAARSTEPFSWNGERIEGGLRDLDDRLPHAFEVITTGGAYLWVDFGKVRRVAFEPPVRTRDLALRVARLDMRDGSSADVLIPAIYPDATGETADDALALGQRTDFVDQAGGATRGRGLRAFLVGDESRPILDAAVVEWEAADG